MDGAKNGASGRASERVRDHLHGDGALTGAHTQEGDMDQGSAIMVYLPVRYLRGARDAKDGRVLPWPGGSDFEVGASNFVPIIRLHLHHQASEPGAAASRTQPVRSVI